MRGNCIALAYAFTSLASIRRINLSKRSCNYIRFHSFPCIPFFNCSTIAFSQANQRISVPLFYRSFRFASSACICTCFRVYLTCQFKRAQNIICYFSILFNLHWPTQRFFPYLFLVFVFFASLVRSFRMFCSNYYFHQNNLLLPFKDHNYCLLKKMGFKMLFFFLLPQANIQCV